MQDELEFELLQVEPIRGIYLDVLHLMQLWKVEPLVCDQTYPHPPIADGWPILGQSQHKQVHFVLPPSTDTKTKPLHAFVQFHGEEVKVLRKLGRAA